MGPKFLIRSFELVSSFGLASDLPREKRIVYLFLADRRHWAMTRTQNCFLRQRQDLFEIVSHRVFVGNVAAAHRSGEKRIAHDCNWPGEAVHNESHAAR